MSFSADDSHDRSRLRIGYAERDEVIEILRIAAGEGRITAAELDERIEQADAAKTFADLDSIVADLPVPPPSQAMQGPPGRGPASTLGRLPGHSPEDPMTLNAALNDDKRTGQWQTVPYIHVKTLTATAKLDFTQALNELSEIHVEVEGKAGGAVIVVPDGWGVIIDLLRAPYGSKRAKVPAIPAPGAPLVVVTGAVGVGTFVARGPNYFERKKLNPP